MATTKETKKKRYTGIEMLIKSYLPNITDINQSESVEILPLTIHDMILECIEPIKQQLEKSTKTVKDQAERIGELESKLEVNRQIYLKLYDENNELLRLNSVYSKQIDLFAIEINKINNLELKLSEAEQKYIDAEIDKNDANNKLELAYESNSKYIIRIKNLEKAIIKSNV